MQPYDVVPFEFNFLLMRTFQKGEILTHYKCANQAISITIQNTNKDEYESLLEALLNNGFTKVVSNFFGDNSFCTFASTQTSPSLIIHTNYYPLTNTVKIFYGYDSFLPPQSYAPAEKITNASVTQLGRLAVYQDNCGAPGLLYVLQLEDGRYILIDGGPSDQMVYPMKKDPDNGWIPDGAPRMSNTEEVLEEFLIKHNPGKNTGKPIIACWIFTHAHHDHLELAIDFISSHCDKIDLQMVAYNFPDFDTTEYLDGSSLKSKILSDKLIDTVNEHFPQASHWIMHTGQQAHFPSCTIHVLFTHEDLYPIAPWTSNCNSLAFIVELGSKKICFLGDCDTNSTHIISQNYAAELKCDILQVTHHGANGGNLLLYQKINPQICLWPVSDYLADTNPMQRGTAEGYEFNRWLWDHVKEHYFENKTTTFICQK